MPQALARLRTNLDFMPSPVPDRPGLLIRDAFRYSDVTLIIPPPLIECLRCFDGESTELDLRQELVRITGDFQVGELESNLMDALSSSGFLEDETYARLRVERHREFSSEPSREPTHAGSAYPDEVGPLTETMRGYMSGANSLASGNLIGIAAPHVSPEGGWQSYKAAYAALTPDYKDRTFVVLGTSHYGEPERFGLTRKPFATPFGESKVDLPLLEALAQAAPDAILMEDYCHSIEHSIEFQVLFLQYVYGPDIRILPILCGSYARSIYVGGMPEDHEQVRRFFGALGEMAEKERERLFWVLGIDMAHMGRRYGDPFTATADRGEMADVAVRDRARIDRVLTGDSEGFWDLVQDGQDDLKWCGSSPLYTFLKAVPGARGELHRYEQWNIDEQSVVSFAGISFTKE
ncbi:MAG: AmmeMemoRadiSam system protein B [Bryobacteraceae bacterium]